jgi:hypothetical protein
VSFDGAAGDKGEGEDEGEGVPTGSTAPAPGAAEDAFGAAAVPSSEAVAR